MLRKRACGVVLASLVALLATGCGSDEETEPFTTTAHGTVAVSDGRDTDTPEMDIVRARLTLRRGWFVARITTVKPVKDLDYYLISGISAMVKIQSGGEDWTIDGNYWTNGESDYGTEETHTTCEAVKGIDFEHKHPCQVRFDGAHRDDQVQGFADRQGRFGPGVLRDSEVSRGRLRA